MWLPSEPFDTTAEITEFVRQLGPHDRVAISFWHRVSDVTNRRGAIGDIVERLHRYQAAADKEKQLKLYGYLFTPIPAEINAELDEAFNAGGLTSRTLPRAEHPRVSRLRASRSGQSSISSPGSSTFGTGLARSTWCTSPRTGYTCCRHRTTISSQRWRATRGSRST